jgi:putative phosphoesterase
MKIAVISDSHDHLENIERAVALAGRRGAEALLHCGDICSPFVIDRLAPFDGPVHVVFGNNDGDPMTISRIADRFENVTIHHHTGTLETDIGMIAFTHYPEHGRGLAATGSYAAVFSGHTHRRQREDVSGTPHMNPGELMGLLERPGFVIFDTGSGESETLEI